MWRVSDMNLRHIDTLGMTGPPTPLVGSTLVASTSEESVCTQPSDKLLRQHRNSITPAFYGRNHIKMMQGINDDWRAFVCILVVLWVLTPFRLGAISWFVTLPSDLSYIKSIHPPMYLFPYGLPAASLPTIMFVKFCFKWSNAVKF